MKKLSVESVLPADVATAWELFESARFRDRLAEQTGLRAELLWEREEGGVIVRRLKYISSRELPSVAAAALGSRHLAYEQTNRLDLAGSKLDWVIELPLVADRVSVSGVTTMVAVTEGCKRKVEGRIDVRMPFIGGQIEGFVAADFEKSMARVVELAREMLRSEQAGKA
jgi:hypothetical protein